MKDIWILLGTAVGASFVIESPYIRSLRPYVLPVLVAMGAWHLWKADAASPTSLEWLLTLAHSQGARAEHVVKDVVGLLVLYSLVEGLRALRRLSWREVKASVGDTLFQLTKDLPPVRKKLEEEAMKLEQSLEHSLRPNGHVDPIRVLPTKGRPVADILKQLQGFAGKEDHKWKDGLVSGAVYGGEEDLVELMGQAATLYGLTNPLHPDLFPSLMKFEAEVCSMVANLVNGGDKGVVASLTSGGTESILLAAKSHRDWFRAEKGVRQPEIVACISAHAAIDKACDLMGVRLVKIPMVEGTYALDVRAMERAITANTVMLYASAPTFGQGVIDPIEAVGRLGVKYGVGVHVDCCLGGFVLPFAVKLGYKVPPFDFSVAGVTSMSVDTHKYGYASKGTSVVAYRNKDIRRYQYFCFPAWPGGLYVTPTVAGSRPGALSASCWATMVAIGEEGYRARTKQILETTRTIAQEVQGVEGLYLQGKAEAMIVCVGSEELNVYNVGDLMAKKGWSLNSLQSPPGLHLCVTLRHVGRHARFVKDIKECVEEVRRQLKASGGKKQEGNAAIYGMASTLPAGPINEMLRTYTDVVLKA